jgi:hypothetical protein
MSARTVFRWSSLLPLLLAAPLCAQSSEGERVQQQTPAMTDPYQGGWQATEQKRNADLWRTIAEDQPADKEALLNQYRSERNASLARNEGVIPAAEQAHLDALSDRLEIVAPNTFEAHLAHFYATFPAPESFMSLDLATARDRERPELVGPQLVNAARRDNSADLARWGRALKEHGDVAPGLWRVADDILCSVDKNGVLFTAGEMDAYPLWAKQAADGVRTDVLVVDDRLLADAAYRQRIWEKARAKGAVPAQAAGFMEHLALATGRPVYLSLALGPQRAGTMRDKLYVTGLAARYSLQPLDNIPALAKCWSAMAKATDAGPLSRNYLLPGAVLLQHYRTVGDEKNAALLEHELRELAQRLGATDRMIRSGVFQH